MICEDFSELLQQHPKFKYVPHYPPFIRSYKSTLISGVPTFSLPKDISGFIFPDDAPKVPTEVPAAFGAVTLFWRNYSLAPGSFGSNVSDDVMALMVEAINRENVGDPLPISYIKGTEVLIASHDIASVLNERFPQSRIYVAPLPSRTMAFRSLQPWGHLVEMEEGPEDSSPFSPWRRVGFVVFSKFTVTQVILEEDGKAFLDQYLNTVKKLEGASKQEGKALAMELVRMSRYLDWNLDIAQLNCPENYTEENPKNAWDQLKGD